jgi:uncharacterized membrane protein (UPF0127 family)
MVVGVSMWFGAHMEHRMRAVNILAGSTTITADVADTPSARAKGLSGKPYLASDHGMLFIFPNGTVGSMWMKDMQYAVDILWLDSDKRVVHIAARVSPDSYPHVFTAPVPAAYILEVPAGSVARWHITEGSELLF